MITTQGFIVRWGCAGRKYRYFVNTLEEASAKWTAWRDAALADGVGPRDCSGAIITGQVAIYRVAWDGSVWSGRERVPLRKES